MHQNNRKETKCLWLSIFIFSLICIVLFFSLLWPEIIKHNTYQMETCQVTGLDIKSLYSCNIGKNNCARARIQQSCNSVKAHLTQLNPDKCLNDSSQCAATLNECNYGYTCCQTKCRTCTSCSESHNCHHYACHCYCSRPISNTRGFVLCQIYFDSILTLQYIRNNTHYHNNLIYPFKTKLDLAQQFIHSYNISETMKCWHPKSNMQSIVLSIDYTLWKWIIFSIFASILCIFLFIVLYLHLQKIYYKYNLDKMDILARKPPSFHSDNPSYSSIESLSDDNDDEYCPRKEKRRSHPPPIDNSYYSFNIPNVIPEI